MHDADRTALLPNHAFLGSSVRQQIAPADMAAWLDADAEIPMVYVSFGSFLSVRADVLARVASALAGLPVRVALAVGSADPAVLGELPDRWLVREFLPQVALLERAALAVTHGGNNSVTEALTFGVPMVVLPFSTDQFAGAAAVENAGVGVVLDPNRAGVAELRAAMVGVLEGAERATAQAVGQSLRSAPGREIARAAVGGLLTPDPWVRAGHPTRAFGRVDQRIVAMASIRRLRDRAPPWILARSTKISSATHAVYCSTPRASISWAVWVCWAASARTLQSNATGPSSSRTANADRGTRTG